MSKDPAWLCYSDIFYMGTIEMTNEEIGQYFRILLLSHQKGRMDEKTISFLVGSISDKVKVKFKIDDDGKWYNERFELEMDKRKAFVESRVNNGKLGGRPKKSETDNKPSGKPSENLIKDKDIIVIKSIVKYLNKVTNKKFKYNADKSLSHISARLKDGYIYEDFKTVIDKKFDTWKDDPKMASFLRPETLFGNKFDGYLNELASSGEDETKKSKLDRFRIKFKELVTHYKQKESEESSQEALDDLKPELRWLKNQIAILER